MSDSEITHDFLIEQAAAWLRKKGNAVIITDMAHGHSETPDAIGWQQTNTTLIEVKVSRSDFLADRKKWFRQFPKEGMGAERYFCAPKGMLSIEELPDGWGLLEWDGKRLRAAKRSDNFGDKNWRAEVSLLLSALRRIGQDAPKGVSIKHYTFESKNRATLGVAKLEEVQP